MAEVDMKDLERRMSGAYDMLGKEFSGLRTGRASTGLLENVQVEAYGSQTPLTQVGSISVPEARLLTIQVWDANLIKPVEKAIANSGLGLNPQPDGNLIRVPIPDLTEERRIELAKVAGSYSENAKISVRNVRRDGMETVKKSEKDGDISEDDRKRLEDEVQKLTDNWVKKIDEAFVKKEEEIKQV